MQFSERLDEHDGVGQNGGEGAVDKMKIVTLDAERFVRVRRVVVPTPTRLGH